MVKTGLKVYKNNIWHFFTILGFVALGLIIALSIALPVLSSAVTNAANQIGNKAKDLGLTNFNTGGFINSLYNQFKSMDWKDPIKTLQTVFTQNNLVNIFSVAAQESGLDVSQIQGLTDTFTVCANDLIKTSIDELTIIISCISITSICGYVLIRTSIHFKTTDSRNILKYILTTIINVLFISLIFYLIVLVLGRTSGAGLYISLIAVLLLMIIGTLTISFIGYHQKGTSFKEIVNVKTILGSVISDLIISLLSFVIIVIIAQFNGLAALMIAIPLLLITTIIMDSTTNAFVNNYNKNV